MIFRPFASIAGSMHKVSFGHKKHVDPEFLNFLKD